MDCILYLIKESAFWRLTFDAEAPDAIIPDYYFTSPEKALIWAGGNGFAVFYMGKAKCEN